MFESKNIDVLKGRKLSLENAKIIGSGAMCTVYLMPDDNVVKVLKSTDFKEAEREIKLAKWAFSKGIPTAISYDVADVDGHPGLVYESLGRGNLRNELRDNPDKFSHIMGNYLELIKKINSVSVEEGQLPSMKQLTITDWQKLKSYFCENDYNEVMRLVETIPEDNHLIHGDCHIKNIKVQNGNFFLIDFDTLSVGDPIFELSGLCCCYDAYENTDESGYNTFFDIDNSIVNAAYNYILNNYYPDISEKDKTENRLKIELFTYICMLNRFDPDNPDEKSCFDKMFAKVNERLYKVSDLVLKR